jgi:hypothetical protein
MPIEDLTAQLKVLKSNGPADLELSESARNDYVGLIQDFRRELKTQRDKVAGLQSLGFPGTIPSAELTQRRLMVNVIHPEGMLPTLDKYIDYLDELEATVNAAFKRMQAEA